MYKTLSPGAIGVKPRDLEEAISFAHQGGFGGLEFSAAEVADLIDQHGADHVKGLFSDAGIRPAACGLPVDWRTSEANWRASLEQLPRLAAAAAAIGATRMSTYILSWSDELPLEQNRHLHVERFTPIARVLAEHGCGLGLEFLGPKTLRDGKAHVFIHTMEDMLAMADDIGPNVGLLLDCWHWHTSRSTVADIEALRSKQVVYVHVNDAPAGVDIDDQLDSVRGLPGETGVIDIRGFLGALQSIDYDGPITPEPFKKELADLPSDADRLERVGAAMNRIFERAGL